MIWRAVLRTIPAFSIPDAIHLNFKQVHFPSIEGLRGIFVATPAADICQVQFGHKLSGLFENGCRTVNHPPASLFHA